MIQKSEMWRTIAPYDCWSCKEYSEDTKNALKKFLVIYNNEHQKVTTKSYQNIQVFLEQRQRHLNEIKQSIDNKLYLRACNGLLSLLYYTSKSGSIFDDHIYKELNDILMEL